MTALPSEHSKTAARGGARQVLTFWLGSESYCVDILRVQEIRGWSPVTRIPKLPPDILGVLNLRGSIVPIVDLRVRFNLSHCQFTPLTVIIVVSFKTSSGERDFGLVVDGVSDVIDISELHLQEAPRLGNRAAVDFIQGMVVIADRMMILLNLDELFGRDSEQWSAADLESVA
jgi:purine-binding chemotaxis protein CheW